MSADDTPTVSPTRDLVPKRIQAPKRPNARYVETVNNPEGGLKYQLKPAGYDLVASLAAEGNTEATIAARLGINRHTLTDLKKRDTNLVAALQRGEGELATELTHILLSQARDGNTVAAIFLGKARCGWRDQGPSDPNATNAPTVNIQINAPLSTEDFLKVVGPLPPEIEGDAK